jgi:drug/metabolite transporter (DMT)-like permease
MSRYADLSLALMALIWGAMFVVAKAALDDVSSVLYLALRFSLAAVVLGLVFGRKIRFDWVGVGLGVVLMTGYILQTIGLQSISAAKNAFLTSGYIVGVPLLGWLVYRNQTRVAEILGVLTTMTGMGLLSMQGEKLTIERGDALTLGCAAVYAVHIVLLGHFAPRIPYETLSFLQVAAAAAFAWVALPFVETPAIRWRPAVILAIVAGGLLATALAFVVQTWAQQYTTPTRAALIFALEPVFAWLGAWWWNGEILTGRAAAGAALILAGVLLVELKPNRKTAHP